jgi:hypothetical protein
MKIKKQTKPKDPSPHAGRFVWDDPKAFKIVRKGSTKKKAKGGK